jgi:hypothetical protein
MKKIAAFGLAAAMALAATAASSDAFANPHWPQPFPPMMMHHHHHHPHGNYLYFSTPFFFGFSFGPQYPHLYVSRHVQWCLDHYRTYNPATNLFFIKKGVPAVCISPFSY